MRGARAVLGIVICALSAGVAGLDSDSRRTPTDGFALALAPRDFQFPRDHGPHPEYRHEWWYLTGNLDATGGERFGFELAFFRLALAPPAEGVRDQTSRWRARQIYMGHFAITDVALSRFRFEQKYARDALGLAGARAEPFRVWLDDWSLGGDATWNVHARGPEYELTLDVQALGEPVLQGERGLSRKASEPGVATYYYSIPRLPVRGRVLRGGRSFEVSGVAWLDREWGTVGLGADQQGWDWFALQLDDGSTLMFYALRDRGGGRDPYSSGMWIDASGRRLSLRSDDVDVAINDYWVSPRGGRYPARWRLRVPALGMDVEVRPVLADQELGTRPRYWEGSVDVRGTRAGRVVSGRGYVELVGYATQVSGALLR